MSVRDGNGTIVGTATTDSAGRACVTPAPPPGPYTVAPALPGGYAGVMSRPVTYAGGDLVVVFNSLCFSFTTCGGAGAGLVGAQTQWSVSGTAAGGLSFGASAFSAPAVGLPALSFLVAPASYTVTLSAPAYLGIRPVTLDATSGSVSQAWYVFGLQLIGCAGVYPPNQAITVTGGGYSGSGTSSSTPWQCWALTAGSYTATVTPSVEFQPVGPINFTVPSAGAGVCPPPVFLAAAANYLCVDGCTDGLPSYIPSVTVTDQNGAHAMVPVTGTPYEWELVYSTTVAALEANPFVDCTRKTGGTPIHYYFQAYSSTQGRLIPASLVEWYSDFSCNGVGAPAGGWGLYKGTLANPPGGSFARSVNATIVSFTCHPFSVVFAVPGANDNFGLPAPVAGTVTISVP